MLDEVDALLKPRWIQVGALVLGIGLAAGLLFASVNAWTTVDACGPDGRPLDAGPAPQEGDSQSFQCVLGGRQVPTSESRMFTILGATVLALPAAWIGLGAMARFGQARSRLSDASAPGFPELALWVDKARAVYMIAAILVAVSAITWAVMQNPRLATPPLVATFALAALGCVNYTRRLADHDFAARALIAS